MPFVYDESNIERPADDSEPPPPSPEQFVYLPPPELGGARDPVRFSVSPAAASAPQAPPAAPTIWQRIFGSAASSSTPSGDPEAASLNLLVPALRQIGARRVYCRYDGGNDEGFAWLDSVELAGGEKLDIATTVERLWQSGIEAKLRTANLFRRNQPTGIRDELHELLHDWLPIEWAGMLLGHGFGTGEYSMYGAFTVDLDAMTISDDRNAEPVVEHITIAKH